MVTKRKRYRLAGAIDWQLAVFPLRVEAVADDYPEAGERQRQWFPPEKAAALVHPSSLGPVLRDIAEWC